MMFHEEPAAGILVVEDVIDALSLTLDEDAEALIALSRQNSHGDEASTATASWHKPKSTASSGGV
jgi:hypothetical protein